MLKELRLESRSVLENAGNFLTYSTKATDLNRQLILCTHYIYKFSYLLLCCSGFYTSSITSNEQL